MSEGSFGRRLRAMRQQLGLTQTELAGDDMSTSFISLLESGKRRPNADTVARLAARLHTPPELLADDDDEEPGPVDDQTQLDLCDAHLNLLSGDVDAACEWYDRIWTSPGAGKQARRESLLGLAWCTERLGNLGEAVERYTQWLGTADEAHDDFDTKITTVTRICSCQREIGRAQEAVSLAEQTLTELRAIGLDRTPAAVTLRVELIGMYRDEGLDRSADRLADGLPAALEQLADLPAHRDAYWRASHAAREQGRHSLALGLARRALTTHRFGLQTALSTRLAAGAAVDPAARLAELRPGFIGLAGPADAGRYEIEFAESQLAAGAPERAESAARSALDLLDEGCRRSRAQATLILGRAGWTQGRQAEAAAAYSAAARMFEEAGLSRFAARAYLELAARHEEVGETTAALAGYRRAAELMGAT